MSQRLQQELENAGPNLFGSNELLRSVLAASNDCIKILDLDGNLQFMSEGGKRVMEVDDFGPLKGCPWPSFWVAEGQVAAVQAVAEAKAGRTGHFRGPANTAKGNARHWDVRVSPILDADGKPEYLLSVSRDVTKEWEAEITLKESLERQKLLTGELQHRITNTLAIVSAIARQTFKSPAEIASRDLFDDRIQALVQAHLLLTQTSWDSATLATVVSSGLKTHHNDQVVVAKDLPKIILPAKAALALTLALNELATNAIKYGALSRSTGKIEINWTREEIAGVPSLRFTWTESGGPTLPPSEKIAGFGSRLITRLLPADFGGEVSVAYPPSGFELILTAPLDGLHRSEATSL